MNGLMNNKNEVNMDYEKKYKEALEIAKSFMNPNRLGATKEELVQMFPELKESEDEKIRKELIRFVKGYFPDETSEQRKAYLAWLEKQGSQILANSCKTCKDEHINFIEKIQIGDQVTRNEDGVLVNLSQLKRVAEKVIEDKESATKFLKSAGIMDESGELAEQYRQGEQKPVNIDYISGIRKELLGIEDNAKNIEGLTESQWVAIRAAHRLLGEYIAKEQKPADNIVPKFKVGDIIRHKEQGFTCKIIAVDTEYRLTECNGTHLPFDSQDAYELVEQNPAELGEDRSKELSLSLQIQAYLNIVSDELYAKGKPLYSKKRVEDVHKCMLMWQKLHNAYFYQKPAWSEEDELMCTSIIQTLKLTNGAAQMKIDWFKSLKDRYTWKPSEEQMATLWDAISNLKHDNYEWVSVLQELFQDLKKLREE